MTIESNTGTVPYRTVLYLTRLFWYRYRYLLICYLYVDINKRTHLGKDALVGLLEEGGVEAVPHDHVTAREVAAGAHLQQSRLVQRARVQVWVGGNTTCRNQSMKNN